MATSSVQGFLKSANLLENTQDRQALNNLGTAPIADDISLFINNNQNDFERQKNYNCDVTYATNSELGFDYLRDNMKYSKKEMVQREHFFSIVDEIDSCLIDEQEHHL